jgi:predicted nucleic acid-binding protein
MIVFDASTLIALSSSVDLHHKWARDVFNETLDRQILVSAVTYAEVLVYPERAGKTAEFEKSIQGLDLKIIDITSEDAAAIASIRSEFKLLMPDAIVLHTAKKFDSALATSDAKLAGAARKLKLEVFQPDH